MSFRCLAWFSVCTVRLLLAGGSTAGQIYSFSSPRYSASADSQSSGNSLANDENLGSEKAVPLDDLTGVAFKSSVELIPVSVCLPVDTKTKFGAAKGHGNRWRDGFGGDDRGTSNVISSALKNVGHIGFQKNRALRE